jgi:hypothetical protein
MPVEIKRSVAAARGCAADREFACATLAALFVSAYMRDNLVHKAAARTLYMDSFLAPLAARTGRARYPRPRSGNGQSACTGLSPFRARRALATVDGHALFK